MAKALRKQLEDELSDLWGSGRVATNELIRQRAPLVWAALRLDLSGSDPQEILAAFTTVPEDQALNALGVAFGLDSRFPESGIDHRFIRFAALYGRGHERSARRWAKQGVAALAELLEKEYFVDWLGTVDISVSADSPRQVLVTASRPVRATPDLSRYERPRQQRPTRLRVLVANQPELTFQFDDTKFADHRGELFEVGTDPLMIDLQWDGKMRLLVTTMADVPYWFSTVRFSERHAGILCAPIGRGGRADK